MRYFFLLASILFMVHSVAYGGGEFTKPDYETIEKVTKDPRSQYYYSKLMKRYTQNDTTLSLKDIHMLYYGPFFQSDNTLNVFGNNEYQDSIKAIYRKDKLEDADLHKLVSYYLQVVSKSPFELKNLNALYNLYSDLHDPAARLYDHKLSALIEVIMATGDGKTKESGIYVNSISDEYAMLSVMGLRWGGSQSLMGKCDYLEVAANDNNIKGIYFNIEKILEAELKMFKTK